MINIAKRVTRVRCMKGETDVPGFLTSIRILPTGTKVTRRMLRSMYRRTAVPVSETHRALGSALGMYRLQPSHIYVSPRLPLYKKAAVFLHELGHHRCHNTGCVCEWRDCDIMCEAHAYAFEVRATMWLGLMRSHHWAMSHIIRSALRLPSPKKYDRRIRYEAAHKVIGCKDWNELYQFGYGPPYNI